MRTRDFGFTLIELMVVVAIIGILAAIAYPSYRSYILRSHRAEAYAMLQAAQLAQEKYRLNHTTYADTTALSDPVFGGVCPSGNCTSPNGYYTLTSPTASATAGGYALTATAAGTQVADTACSSIVITQTAGVVTHTPAECWRK